KLNGQLGYLAGTPEKVLQHNSLIWTISAGLSIPVFTGGRNAGAVAATDARSQQARVVYEQVIRRAGHEVQEALNQLQRRAEQVSILQRALASARTNAALAREQFRKGLSNYLNVVIADRSALDAENNLLLAQGEQLVQTVMLVKAAGGGWDGE
ncbi:MAG: TolC family protein, partial [Bacteroidota bacterium]